MLDWAEKCKLAEKYFKEISVFRKNVDFKHEIECESIASYFRIVFSHISKHLQKI
jgi:restriction endonuclease